MKISKILLSLMLIIGIFTVGVNNTLAVDNILSEVVNSEIMTDYSYYYYNAEDSGYLSQRSNILTPTYYIFAGEKDLIQANQLIADLEMIDNVNNWGSQIYVINPLNNAEYSADDVIAFKKIVGMAARNVKVIGIDTGVNFVNDYLTQDCYFIAGMMTIDSQMNTIPQLKYPIPMYLSNPDQTTEDYFIKVNNASLKETKENNKIFYSDQNKLQRVSISNGLESLAEAFKNAWESVFSYNYRYHNSTTEFYNMPVIDTNLSNAYEPYDLVEIPLFDRLDMDYNQMINQKVSTMPGEYTWFEYVPKQVYTSNKSSVPLIITLHGNQNDPRIQGDTSGWVELAAKENILIVSPEYQDKSDHNFSGCDGLGVNGVTALIKDLQIKYPQIDSSRIYITGLSLGGATSMYMGLKESRLFAGVASVSGVNALNDDIQNTIKDYSGVQIPLLYICGDHDFFQMIPVDGSSIHGTSELYGFSIWNNDKNVHIYEAIQAYQKANGIQTSPMDMSKNKYYGLKLENEKTQTLGSKIMHTGQLSNDNGVIMELAAVENLAHWNYKPEAQYIWDFFKNYARDTKTGELIAINQPKSEEITQIVATTDSSSYIVAMVGLCLSALVIFRTRSILKYNAPQN